MMKFSKGFTKKCSDAALWYLLLRDRFGLTEFETLSLLVTCWPKNLTPFFIELDGYPLPLSYFLKE